MFINKFKDFLHDVSKEEGGEEYYNLALCIRSGQVSARQVQEHLKDKDFYEYYMKNFCVSFWSDIKL
jgi:hypothetical protein|tara:strand:+ start:240 stop:440 length:201 start_codon:yes stop_codon:yes gene_type:complete